MYDVFDLRKLDTVRTNVDIDDTVLAEAMKAGPFKTKKEAVDAGLRLLARQAAYRELLRYEGRLTWTDGGDEGEAADERPPAAAAARRRTRRG